MSLIVLVAAVVSYHGNNNSDDADGEDDDHGRHNLRFVLAASAYDHSSWRLASKHLEVSFSQ